MTKLTEKSHEEMTAETEAGKEKTWLIVNRVEALSECQAEGPR